ncbi:Zn(2)-C6 fungal-type domain-containing protein [Fusarium falciforme]|uniref:Zn(2)-C6 fungal-type domain-containing protein n=1 Tax=Fusarium falciforme TaxID=195108 RepID=UPI002301C2ED|nr:Zn(2)-C6 fungal-type domain-containing protein [Fusarium falciforme]WAO94637.1 Zn(2)-C6 fungal-type domain-containing protein [Fusarium falciforme]
MSPVQENTGRRSQRCQKACSRCRDMKVRCSGTYPCARCQRKRKTCDFQSTESRVSISRSYLRSLESRAGDDQSPRPRPDADLASRDQGATPDEANLGQDDDCSTQSGLATYGPTSARAGTLPSARLPSLQPERSGIPTPATDSSNAEFNTNPLIGGDETFAVGSDGKFWFLGPTSSWSFCRRVLSLIASRLPEHHVPPDPWTLAQFDLNWTPLGADESPAINDLPAQDYATFLAHTVKYHLGTLSPILDDQVFFVRINDLYSDPAAEVQRSRLWYAQFLLVLAFGEAIVNSKGASATPGTQYASRAMSLIPNFFRVNKNSILAVETLCLAALYLQSLDLRLEAFQTIGQALRICTLEGFHRHASPAEVGPTHSRRCNTMFWATYILDRHFSTLVGAPSSIRDEDITAKLPSETVNSSWALAMTLNIRLSRLTAEILAGVYGTDAQVSDTLVKKTQSMLHSTANLSSELNRYLQTNVHGTTIKSSSRIATRLLLSYHHCIVLATRPLVMCVLQKHLAQGVADEPIPEGPVSSLLQTCVDSASTILATLKNLRDADQLDCFIPFQLEEAFSSAFILHVIASVVPSWLQDRPCLPVAHLVLNKMIAGGSHGARIRKMELQRLERIFFSYLRVKAGEANNQASQSEEAPRLFDMSRVVPQDDDSAMMQDYSPADDMAAWNLLDLQDSFTVSPSGLLTLAEGLDLQNFV